MATSPLSLNTSSDDLSCGNDPPASLQAELVGSRLPASSPTWLPAWPLFMGQSFLPNGGTKGQEWVWSPQRSPCTRHRAEPSFPTALQAAQPTLSRPHHCPLREASTGPVCPQSHPGALLWQMVQVVDYVATLTQDQGPDIHRARFFLSG